MSKRTTTDNQYNLINETLENIEKTNYVSLGTEDKETIMSRAKDIKNIENYNAQVIAIVGVLRINVERRFGFDMNNKQFNHDIMKELETLLRGIFSEVIYKNETFEENMFMKFKIDIFRYSSYF